MRAAAAVALHAGEPAAAAERAPASAAAAEQVGALIEAALSRMRDAAEKELRRLGRTVHRRTPKGSADGVGVETLTVELARTVERARRAARAQGTDIRLRSYRSDPRRRPA